MNAILRKAVAGLRRGWYGAFINQRWTIGMARGELACGASWIQRGRLFDPLPGGDFLADPFIVPGTEGRVLLCEWMRARHGRGVIARVELGVGNGIEDVCLLIDWPPYHLSYPHVFVVDGELYCCPEACYSRSVRLFRLSPDARRVLDSQTILSGFAAVDPTVLRFGSRWWLFCTSADGHRANTHLHAFYSSSLIGPWTPHSANPIVVGASTARPGGRMFVSDGRLYRPAQDCSVRYGGGLRLLEVEELTPDSYREALCWSISPPVGEHGQHGIHTANAADGFITYDAYTERFSPIAWLYRLRERYR